MGDEITIGVTEIVNNIEVTAQPNDQVIDINVTDNSDEVTLNVTPNVIEVNINKGSSYARWGSIFGNLTDQTDLTNALFNKADLVDGKVPAYQLPSFVDDVIEVANFAALPTVGEIGKIYVTLDNNKIYRWSGSVYIEIAANQAVWGSITGTLSNQLDLVGALNLKANDNAVVKLTGNQSIAGIKTFTDNIVSNTFYSSKIISGGYIPDAGYSNMYSNDLMLTFNQMNAAGTAVTTFNFVYPTSNTLRTYNLPNSDGTLALTSQLHNAVTIGTANGLSLSNQVLSLGLASASTNGALSSSNWTTFNNKQNALNGTGFVKISGTTISYDNSTYALDSDVVKLATDQTISGQKTFLNNVNIDAGINLDDAFGLYWKTNVGAVETALAGIGQSSSGLNFFTGSSLSTPKMVINSSGNVGIGTTSPSEKLEVIGIIKTNAVYTKDGTNPISNYLTYTGTDEGYFVQYVGGVEKNRLRANGNSFLNGGNVGIGTTSPITGNLVISPTTANGTVEGLSILFHPDGALSRERVKLWINGFNGQLDLKDSGEIKRVQITSLGNSYFNGGNVGIGTTSPSYILQTKAGSGFVGAAFSSSYAATSIIGNDANSSWFGQGTNGLGSAYVINNTSGYAQIELGGSPRFYVNSSGNVGIGTTTDAGFRLDVDGTGRFSGNLRSNSFIAVNKNGANGVGEGPYFVLSQVVDAKQWLFQLNGSQGLDYWHYNGSNWIIPLNLASSGAATFSSSVTATSFITSSDKRLKNIISRDGDLAVYNLLDSEEIHYGYIAQDMQEKYPNQVHENDEGFLSLNYIEILVKKVNDLEKQIEILKNKQYDKF